MCTSISGAHDWNREKIVHKTIESFVCKHLRLSKIISKHASCLTILYSVLCKRIIGQNRIVETHLIDSVNKTTNFIEVFKFELTSCSTRDDTFYAYISCLKITLLPRVSIITFVTRAANATTNFSDFLNQFSINNSNMVIRIHR